MKKIIALLIMLLVFVGCEQPMKGEVEPKTKEVEVVEIETAEQVEDYKEEGRPEQAEMLLAKLNVLYSSERELSRKMYEGYAKELGDGCKDDSCFESWKELIYYTNEEALNLVELRNSIADEILDKRQYIDVNLADLYEELSKELSTKAQEGRVRLTDFYEKISLLPKATTKTSDYECSYNKYNCADFNTQAEAQAVMIYCGNDDIHYLDGDDDGIACEALK